MEIVNDVKKIDDVKEMDTEVEKKVNVDAIDAGDAGWGDLPKSVTDSQSQISGW